MFIYGTLVCDLYCSHANQYIQWYMTFIHVAIAKNYRPARRLRAYNHAGDSQSRLVDFHSAQDDRKEA